MDTEYFNPRSRRFRWINPVSALLGLGLLVLGWYLRGVQPLLDLLKQGYAPYYLYLIGLLLICPPLQALTHGLLLKLVTGQVRFARKKLRLFAGSEEYLTFGQFLFCRLTPLAFWGLATGIACVFLQGLAFWLCYGALILHVGAGVEDVALALCARKNCQFQDFGMSVYMYREEV